MMKQLLKIDKMHKLFGKVDDVCRNCKHFRKFDTSGIMSRPYLQKCEVYGITHSENSDWAQKWQACGMFNRPYDDNARRVIEIPVKAADEETELEGQIRAMQILEQTRDNEWISVDDRLPEEDVSVLVYGTTGLMGVAYLLDYKWFTKNYLVEITHWRPLPEPPKEE